MTHNEFSIESSTGRIVLGNSWTVENAIANVILIHGMAEYSLRYDHFAKFLSEHKINVFALDHIGHGKNAYHGLGVWSKNGFRKNVRNIKILVDHLILSSKPLFLVAHSMGSFMLQDYISTYSTTFIKGVVLVGSSGPQFKFKLAARLARFIRVFKKGSKPSKFLSWLSFSSYNKRIKNNKSKNAWICSDDKVVEEYDKDELCGFIPSVFFFESFFKALANLHEKEKLSKINSNLNVLMLGGKEDPVSCYGKTLTKLQAIYSGLGITSTLKLYPNMRHEILNETDKEIVYSDILDFIQKSL